MHWSITNQSMNEGSVGSPLISVPVGKTITAIVMFLTVSVALYTPVIIFSRLNLSRQRSTCREKLKLWIGRLSCFAAGVFLSTGFMDIFPDVSKAITEAGKKLNIEIDYPLPSFFTLLGFFLILSIEQFIMIYKSHLNAINPVLNDSDSGLHTRNEESQEAFLSDMSRSNDTGLWTEDINREVKLRHAVGSIDIEQELLSQNNGSSTEEVHHDHGSIFHYSKSRIFTLMSALSVHAVFEGLAIGLGSTITGVTQLFIALSMHKLVIAASLGLNLATAMLKIWVKIVVGLIFAVASPIGIGLGILIMSQEKDHNAFYLVAGILEGLACGTFLYVVFFEMLLHELGHGAHGDRAGKLFSVIFGFILVSVYLLIIQMK